MWSSICPCAVARKVGRAEIEKVSDAKAAVDKEWTKLAEMPHPDKKGKGTWDVTTVCEVSEVREKFHWTSKKSCKKHGQGETTVN